MSDERQPELRDVREKGFADRASAEQATSWLNQFPAISDSAEIPVDDGAGRILSEPFVAPTDAPPHEAATKNGYALRSSETVGAGSYNPLLFRIQDGNHPLMPNSAALVCSGMCLPQGADAVASFDLVRAGKDAVELMDVVAQGEGVSFQGQETAKGTIVVGISRPMRPSDLALLLSFNVQRVRVIRQPRVRLIIPGGKAQPICEPFDADGPMLRALAARDGGVIELSASGVTTRAAMAELIARPGADVVLVCGRTGTGSDDEAPLALRDAGTLSMHGIAVEPGASTGLGSVGKVPVILLPGEPADCLCAYDLFAGPFIRRVGRRSPSLPYRLQHFPLGRKIVSSVGNLELCRVRLVDGKAIPLGGIFGGLASQARADGFVLVPAALEGYAPGTRVGIYLYDYCQGVDDIAT